MWCTSSTYTEKVTSFCQMGLLWRIRYLLFCGMTTSCGKKTRCACLVDWLLRRQEQYSSCCDDSSCLSGGGCHWSSYSSTNLPVVRARNLKTVAASLRRLLGEALTWLAILLKLRFFFWTGSVVLCCTYQYVVLLYMSVLCSVKCKYLQF